MSFTQHAHDLFNRFVDSKISDADGWTMGTFANDSHVLGINILGNGKTPQVTIAAWSKDKPKKIGKLQSAALQLTMIALGDRMQLEVDEDRLIDPKIVTDYNVFERAKQLRHEAGQLCTHNGQLFFS